MMLQRFIKRFGPINTTDKTKDSQEKVCRCSFALSWICGLQCVCLRRNISDHPVEEIVENDPALRIRNSRANF